MLCFLVSGNSQIVWACVDQRKHTSACTHTHTCVHAHTHTKHPAAAAAAKLLQSCPTLCNPRDSSPPGSLVPGILQARTLEWVAISFSNAWKWKVKVKSHSTWFSFYRSHGLQPTRLLCPWDFPGKRVLEWGAIAFSDTISWPHMKCSGFLRRKKTWLLFP